MHAISGLFSTGHGKTTRAHTYMYTCTCTHTAAGRHTSVYMYAQESVALLSLAIKYFMKEPQGYIDLMNLIG